MKILLMLPIVDWSKMWGSLSKGAGNNNFNYGLASIAAVLRREGYQVEVLDPQFMRSDQQVTDFLVQGGYDLVGITAYTPTISDAYRTADLVRQALPYAMLVLGGPHCSYFPKESLADCPAVDYSISREGEYTLLELVEMLEHGRHEAENILGLVYRDGDNIVQTAPRPFLDVNQLPPPAYDLFPLDKYHLQPTVYKRLPTITTLVSRGCPYSCTFCHGFEILGRKMRYKSVNNAVDELSMLHHDFGARGFMFHDSTFTFDQNWVWRFCDEVIARKLDVTWMCLTRVDRISQELLAHMKRAGCFGVSFGIESANQKSLDLLKKMTTVAQNAAAIKMAKKVGLFVTTTYMVGLPGENQADFLRTVEFARKNPAHIAHFFWPLPYPKTLFYDQCEKVGGIKKNAKWEDFNIFAKEPVYINPLIGYERMVALQKYAYRTYYMKPSVLLMHLKQIDSLTDIKKYWLAAMAVFGQILR